MFVRFTSRPLSFLSTLVLALSVVVSAADRGHTQERVEITVDAGRTIAPMEPFYAYFGYDEPNYTYMHDGRKLLTEIAEANPVPVYVRAHNLLNTGDGEAALKWGSTNAYTENEHGEPVYDWTLVDRIFDTYVERDIRPLVEIGFMPRALSSNPDPYRHSWSPDQPYGEIYTGWAYPPSDYEKWAELTYRLVRHAVDRYGREEVETWLWQPWNEPNIDYWQGTKEEYFKLYDYTVDAVKRALPTATVGGPHTTGPRWDVAARWLRDFLEHCRSGTNHATGETGAPLEFIAFHAKGSPEVVDGHVRMDMGVQLDDVATGFEIVAEDPTYSDLPIILGEADPEGCAACSMELHPENGYRNGTMYSSYTVASFAKFVELADEIGADLEGVLSWSFQFEDEDWFAGFRALATNGVDKPVLNVFRMYGMMSGDRVAVAQSDPITAREVIERGVRGDSADVNALAAVDEERRTMTVMVWNYHDHDLPAAPTEVALTLEELPTDRAQVFHYRIDGDHSNSYTVWREMGAPQQVTRRQYERLERSGQLELLTAPRWVDLRGGSREIVFELPRQGVSLLKLSW